MAKIRAYLATAVLWFMGMLVFAGAFCDCNGLCDTDGDALWSVRVQKQTFVTNDTGSGSALERRSLVLNSLQSALLNISHENASSLYCIRLHRGIHLISSPHVLNPSVVLVGEQDGVVVSCNFSREGLPSSTLHSLYFSRSQSVGFINVQAQNCPLPFRLDSVSRVLIENSTFRFVCWCDLDTKLAHCMISVTSCILVLNPSCE